MHIAKFCRYKEFPSGLTAHVFPYYSVAQAQKAFTDSRSKRKDLETLIYPLRLKVYK